MKDKKLQLAEAVPMKVLEIKENGKYLMILPKDARIKEIAEALQEFYSPTKFFCLAVNDVNDIKIAELVEGS